MAITIWERPVKTHEVVTLRSARPTLTSPYSVTVPRWARCVTKMDKDISVTLANHEPTNSFD